MKTAAYSLIGLSLIAIGAYLFAGHGAGNDGPPAAALTHTSGLAEDQSKLDGWSLSDLMQAFNEVIQPLDPSLQALLKQEPQQPIEIPLAQTETPPARSNAQATTEAAPPPQRSGSAPSSNDQPANGRVNNGNTSQPAADAPNDALARLLEVYNLMIARVSAMDIPADAKAKVLASLQQLQTQLQALAANLPGSGQTSAGQATYASTVDALAAAMARINASDLPPEAKARALSALQSGLDSFTALTGAKPSTNPYANVRVAVSSSSSSGGASNFAGIGSVNAQFAGLDAVFGPMSPQIDEILQVVRQALTSKP